jgi:hypothetical protein
MMFFWEIVIRYSEDNPMDRGTTPVSALQPHYVDLFDRPFSNVNHA